MPPTAAVILSQLQPFNEERFDACMAHLATTHARDLTQYEMVQLHVILDLLHTVEHAQPVIGGKLDAWQRGPVVGPAYKRVVHWGRRFDEHGTQPERFSVSCKSDTIYAYKPTVAPDPDDFSPAESKAMEGAWQIVMVDHAGWKKSQDYFHNPKFPVGRVWSEARQHNAAMDWRALVRAWGEYQKLDVTSVLRLIEL